MRKLTGAVFQSLDGVMQAPGGPEEDPSGGFEFGGWSFHYWDKTLEEPFAKVIDAEYDLLLGKRTYDIFAAYWPHNQDIPVVFATYEPAGEVPIGTFETKEPSEAELDRREKWAREEA